MTAVSKEQDTNEHDKRGGGKLATEQMKICPSCGVPIDPRCGGCRCS